MKFNPLKTRSEIKKFFTNYKDAVWRKDAKALINLYGPEMVAFDMWDQGFYGSLTEWIPEMEHWLGSLGEERVQVEFDRIRLHETDVLGFACGYISFKAIAPDGTVLREMTNRISVGFTNENGNWKVIHQHISAPIRSSDLTAVLNL